MKDEKVDLKTWNPIEAMGIGKPPTDKGGYRAMIPKTMTRVFTKYDPIPDEIEVKIPIPDIETPELTVKHSHFGCPYRRYAMNFGLEGVIFVYYRRIELGGFIGEMEGTVHSVKKEEL